MIDDGNGTYTEDLHTDANIPAGKCNVQICTITGKCNATQQLSGINSSSIATDLGANPVANVTPDQGLTFPDQSAGATPDYSLPSSAGSGNTVDCYNESSGAQSCYPANQQDSNNLQAQGYACTAQTGGGSDAGGTDAVCTKNTTTQPVVCNGTISSSATCAQQAPPAGTNVPKGATTPQPPAAQQQSQNPLSALLSGLSKGLSSPCTTATQNPYQNQYVGGNGTTLVPVQTYNPSTGLYSTTYVQQQPATTYPYGTTPYGAQQPCSPLTSAQAPYGVGNNGAACPVPPSTPQCATGATAQPISGSGNGCVTSYQCVPTAGSTFAQTPTPQISCSPQIADVGTSVAISYSCANATGSSGAGFTTNNQTSGSTSTVITAPPSGTNTANFGLTCTNGSQAAGAQCSVQINQPAIVLVANPQTVPSGQPSSIGWVTAGMQSCVISSPQDATFTASNASNQSINGVAQTDAITQSTEFDLTCTTLGGQTKGASTILVVGSATSTQ